MNALQRNAIQAMEDAVRLEREAQLPKALQKYVDAHQLFSSLLSVQGSQMQPASRDRLIAYIRQIEGKTSALKQRGVAEVQQAPERPSMTSHVDPTPTTATRRSETSPVAVEEPIVDVALPKFQPTSIAKKPTPSSIPQPQQPQRPPAASPSTNPSKASSTTGTESNQRDDDKKPDTMKASDTDAEPKGAEGRLLPVLGPSASFAPRTSSVVLRALELATKLSRERKFKQAIDVVQHAYDVGRIEGNNPSNFSKIPELIVDLKKRYYEAFKPRFFQDNRVTAEEMDLLRKSGQLSALLLPVWDDVAEGYAAENVYLPCKGDAWEDAFTPYLSPKQKAAGTVLARFPSVVSNPAKLVVYHTADPFNIKQTVVGDCSLVCSLIVCSHFEKRFPTYNLIRSVIFPQDESGVPIISPKGKYCVKMFVNGITRMVVVDDRIPVSKALIGTAVSVATPETEGGPAPRFLRQPLCTYSVDPTELWVSIIEKAFVKVCGGSYDFPGSNSSVDMFKLSGWLPDGFYFDSTDVNLEVQWRRLLLSHSRGAVLGTVSTPQNLGAAVEDKLKLVPGHAYALLDFREVNGRRLVKIKNPWAKQAWAGLYSLDDQETDRAEVLKALDFTEEEANQGIFWMSWADVCKFFKRCNLSWNPYLLFAAPGAAPKKPTRLAVHGIYSHSDSFALCPQFHLALRGVKRSSRMHVVLSRHVLELSEYANAEDGGIDTAPLITVHVFDVTASPSAAQFLLGRTPTGRSPSCVGGSKACLARRVVHGAELKGGDAAWIHRGIYRNTECQTISFNVPQGDRDLIIVVSQLVEASTPQRMTSFPFSVFLHTELSVVSDGNDSESAAATGTVDLHPVLPLPAASRDSTPVQLIKFGARGSSGEDIGMHTSAVCGEWAAGKSCGGKSDAQTFVFNPQFALTLASPGGHVSATLIAPGLSEAVQLQLVRRRAQPQPPANATIPLWLKRVDHVHPRHCDLVLQSPLYLHKGCVVDTSLPKCLAYDASGVVRPSQPPAEDQPQPTAVTPTPTPSVFGGPYLVQLVNAAVPEVTVERCFLQLPWRSVAFTAALAARVLIHPTLTKVIAGGKQITGDDFTAQMLSGIHPPPGAPHCVVVPGTDQLQRTPAMQQCVIKLYDVARDVVGALAQEDMNAISTICASNGEKLTQLQLALDAVEVTTDSIRESRKGLLLACESVHKLLDCLKIAAASAKTAGSPTVAAAAPPASIPTVPSEADCPMLPLPAGEYIAIPSVWSKGVSGKFSIVVQSTVPHTCSAIPTEGEGWQVTNLQSQLRGAAPPPPATLRPDAVLQHDDALFQSHPTFTVQTVSGSSMSPATLVCRAMTVESDGKRERGSVPVAIVVCGAMGQDAAGRRAFSVMQVTAFTDSSPATAPVVLQPQRQYIVVVCGSSPTTQPIVLRCYASNDITAKVNN